MKKNLVFLSLMFVGLLLPQNIQAQTAKAIWCKGNTTLYFTYDNDDYYNGDFYDGQTAIEAAETEQTLRQAEGIYDATGRQQVTTRRGLNIVRMSDGTVKKVVVK